MAARRRRRGLIPLPDDIAFSGERKRVRRNELLDRAPLLLAQMSTAPTPVSGQRSLADVARERALRTGNATGAKPTAVVLELATPVPWVPLSTYAPRPTPDLGPDYAPGPPTTNGEAFRRTAAARPPAYEPTPTTIAVEKGAADAIAGFGDKAGAAVGLAGLGFGVFALLFVALVWLCSPLIGIRLGRDKGLPDWAGLLAGLFLGPFVLLMVFVKPSHKKCAFCFTSIPIAAGVCPRCTREQPGEGAPVKGSASSKP